MTTKSISPSPKKVRSTLGRYYRTRGFLWLYCELFAELLGCPSSSAIAQNAQTRMRSQYPRFQRKATFFDSSGGLIQTAVEEQSIAVAKMCREVATNSSAPRLAAADLSAMLKFQGPFGLVAGNRCPLIFNEAISELPGIYLWTVPLEEGHLVAYVGKTARSFGQRLQEEIDFNLAGEDGFYDIDQYRRGIRHAISPPSVNATAHLQAALVPCEILVAHLAADDAVLRSVEAALIRRLREHSDRTKKFLGNRHPSRSVVLRHRFRIRRSVPVIGLSGFLDA